MDDYKIEDQTISEEIGFYVRDIFKKSGAHIYNLKVTEWLIMYNFYLFFFSYKYIKRKITIFNCVQVC